MVCVECWALGLVVLLLLYKWSTSTFNVFAKRGIPHYKPLPFIGNGLRFLIGKEGLHKIMLDIYRDTKQHKIFGFYNFRNPFFIVNDPEIIKKLAIKDFDSFANHMKFFDNESDPVIGGMLNVMRGQRWKDMRNTVTPTFTGAKLRGMFSLMNDCFAEGMKYFHGLAGEANSFEIEMKDCFSRLSIDLIATTAFGIKLNSFVDRDNDFYTIGQSFTNSKGSQGIKFMLYSIASKVCKLLGIRPLDEQKINYFNKIVNDTMRQREEQNIVRPDVIQLLMEAEKGAPGRWKREELFAQCFTFFFAAFDNNATLICCACQELMQNPDIQQQLFEEVQSVSETLQGKQLDFETLKGMKYLDMVISETLRKWTLAALTDRECAKDYRVEDAEGNFVCELKQGDNVWFHAIGLHWDPNNFEEPEVFRPERFSEENKHNIKPFTYFPFGLGPRVCIGNRYAIMQAKAMLYYLLKDFRIEPSSKSVKDLMQEIRGFQMDPKGGFWFKLTKRQ